MKTNNIRHFIVLFLIFILIISLFICCSEKLTEAELEIIAIEEKLNKNPDDIDLVIKLIQNYFTNGKTDKLVDLYEIHEEEFVDNPLIICQYGASLAMKAGNSEEIEDKLKWVKKSMIVLDGCVQKFPDNYIPYLWRGMTYSNLPKILNARSLVEDDIKLVMDKYKNDLWKLNTGELGIVYTAYLNVAKEYEDNELFDWAYENLKKDLPDTTLEIYKKYTEFKKKK